MSGDAGAQTHRPPMPPTPFPHRPVRSDSHDSFEDSVMHPPPETTGRMVLAASLADQPLPTTARSVAAVHLSVQAPPVPPGSFPSQVDEVSGESTPDDTSHTSHRSDSKLSLAARARLEERAADRDSGRGVPFAKILRELFEVLELVEGPAAVRLDLLDTRMDGDHHPGKAQMATVQADLSEWLAAIRELKLSFAPDWAPRLASTADLLLTPKMFSSTAGPPESHLPQVHMPTVLPPKSSTTATGAHAFGQPTLTEQPEPRHRAHTMAVDQITLQPAEKSGTDRRQAGEQTIRLRPAPTKGGHHNKLPQGSALAKHGRANSNFIGNILNKVMVDKI